jgi:hypothetical protein
VSSEKDESSEEQDGAGEEAREDERLKVGKADKKCEGVGATMIGATTGAGLSAFSLARIS